MINNDAKKWLELLNTKAVSIPKNEVEEFQPSAAQGYYNPLLFSTMLGASYFLSVSSGNAQTCGVQPTCQELGYDKKASDCINGYLKCPFDQSLVFCEICEPTIYKWDKNNCPVLGGTGKFCGGKYDGCNDSECPAEYKYTTANCTGGNVLTGSKCGQGTWNQCKCDSKYQYDLTNCPVIGGSGNSCGGKYEKCVDSTCPSQYKYNESNCQNTLKGNKCGLKRWTACEFDKDTCIRWGAQSKEDIKSSLHCTAGQELIYCSYGGGNSFVTSIFTQCSALGYTWNDNSSCSCQ